jgi:hypothetical protein
MNPLVLVLFFFCLLCTIDSVVLAEDIYPTDCDQNHLPDWTDLWTGHLADCNLNGKPDQCELAPAPLELETQDLPQFQNVAFPYPHLAQVGGIFGPDLLGYDPATQELIVRLRNSCPKYAIRPRST